MIGTLAACKIMRQVGWTTAQWSEAILVHGRTTACTQRSLRKNSMKEQLGFVQFWRILLWHSVWHSGLGWEMIH